MLTSTIKYRPLFVVVVENCLYHSTRKLATLKQRLGHGNQIAKQPLVDRITKLISARSKEIELVETFGRVDKCEARALLLKPGISPHAVTMP